MSKRKDISAILLGITAALILWITILSREKLIGTPISYHPFHVLVSFLKEVQRGRIGANFLGNIILFMPVGMLIPAVTGRKKMWRSVVAGGGLSLFIEITQLITSRGCFDPDDVMLNVLGCVIGYGLYRAARTVFHKHSGKPSGTNV